MEEHADRRNKPHAIPSLFKPLFEVKFDIYNGKQLLRGTGPHAWLVRFP